MDNLLGAPDIESFLTKMQGVGSGESPTISDGQSKKMLNEMLNYASSLGIGFPNLENLNEKVIDA